MVVLVGEAFVEVAVDLGVAVAAAAADFDYHLAFEPAFVVAAGLIGC